MFGFRNCLAALTCFLVAIVAGASAFAGDTASRHLFGYSSDARWFAFEEFGVQDGSGFPYSNIYIIDTTTDRWAPGTPIRIRIDDENASPGEASIRARKQAKSKLARHGVNIPGRLLFSRPLNEVDPPKGAVTFQPAYPYGPQFTLSTETFEGKKSSRCFVDDRPKGLVLKGRHFDDAEKVLYRDKKVPASRGCPLSYALSDVYAAPAGSKGIDAMVLVYVMTIGFEGNDARFVAIPIEFPMGQ